ncbi:acyltransferase family protein [Nocardioides jensenii]|uniref:hypothetical protein n=1 Tax=Nocardioides jensenii TaxID=1843 RepID=UPI00082E3275|nr:hypothetical protein [Nocardioides jensenii]
MQALELHTSAQRNRVVDLVRVLALVAVVLGHWLKQGWYVDTEVTLHRAGLLGIAPWTHPLTWIFQVIPLFFVVGGYANVVSWRHARAVGSRYGTWLASRTTRLTRPVLPLLVFWAVLAPLAPHIGLGGEWLRIGSLTSLVPLWFLATYLVVVAVAPMSVGAWDRWGPRTLAVGLLAFPVDALSLHFDSTAIGALNLLIVWGTLHQFGYAWRDGTFRRPAHALLLVLLGFGAAVALVWFGPYGVSMVGVSGHGVNNTNPPRATILMLGCALTGMVLLAEPALRRFAGRPRVWRTIVVVEARMMTIYLWHLTALVMLGAVSLWFGGVGLHARPDTLEWWTARPVWIVLLGATTGAVVAVVGRFEDPHPARTRAARGAVLPLLRVGLTVVLLALLADDGLGHSARVPEPWLLVIAAVVVLARPHPRQARAREAGRPRGSLPTDDRIAAQK